MTSGPTRSTRSSWSWNSRKSSTSQFPTRRPKRSRPSARRSSTSRNIRSNMRSTPRRVVITGMGVVTALGDTLDGFWSALCAGHSGVGTLTLFDTTEFKVHFGGQVHGWDPVARFGVKEARHLDRFAQFAMAASLSAVADAGIDFEALPPQASGVIIG